MFDDKTVASQTHEAPPDNKSPIHESKDAYDDWTSNDDKDNVDPNYDDRDFADIEPDSNMSSDGVEVHSKSKDAQTPMASSKDDRGIDRESLKAASSMGSFGLYLLIAVLVGYFLGRFIDNFFDTKPVFIIILISAGVVSSIMELVKNIKKASQLGD